MYVDSIILTICILTVAIIVSWIAYLTEYYKLPYKKFIGQKINFFNVFLSFLMFFTIYIVVTPVIFQLLIHSKYLKKNQTTVMSIIQALSFIFVSATLLTCNTHNKSISIKRLFKDNLFPNSKSFINDIKDVFITVIVSFPVILTTSHISDIITTVFIGEIDKEQIAIKYLKSMLNSNLNLTIAVFLILIGAPLLEEYLFRGLLQTWLRKKLGSIYAILITSICFAFFHYSNSQGLLNIPLIFTLFILSIYLGLIYEKSRSLFSSIFLHVTFNLINVIKIIFTER